MVVFDREETQFVLWWGSGKHTSYKEWLKKRQREVVEAVVAAAVAVVAVVGGVFVVFVVFVVVGGGDELEETWRWWS